MLRFPEFDSIQSTPSMDESNPCPTLVHCQQWKYSPVTIDCRDISFVRLFAGVHLRGSVEQKWCIRRNTHCHSYTVAIQAVADVTHFVVTTLLDIRGSRLRMMVLWTVTGSQRNAQLPRWYLCFSWASCIIISVCIVVCACLVHLLFL